jgi:hypothetical protein
MKLVDILLWVVGVLAAGFALWQFALFATAKDATGRPDMWAGTSHLYTAIAALVVAAVCIVAAFVRRPHVEEEIHITE